MNKNQQTINNIALLIIILLLQSCINNKTHSPVLCAYLEGGFNNNTIKISSKDSILYDKFITGNTHSSVKVPPQNINSIYLKVKINNKSPKTIRIDNSEFKRDTIYLVLNYFPYNQRTIWRIEEKKPTFIYF